MLAQNALANCLKMFPINDSNDHKSTKREIILKVISALSDDKNYMHNLDFMNSKLDKIQSECKTLVESFASAYNILSPNHKN